MKKQELVQIQRLAGLVGHFIRYWGFRNIHGEIWTVMYLSRRALSGADLVEMLEVSKALVSPALKELESEGLIRLAQSENSKTKRYEAVDDVVQVIRDVLERREKPMIGEIMNRYQSLKKDSGAESELNSERLEKLGSMIERAQLTLIMFTESDEMWEL